MIVSSSSRLRGRQIADVVYLGLLRAQWAMHDLSSASHLSLTLAVRLHERGRSLLLA